MPKQLINVGANANLMVKNNNCVPFSLPGGHFHLRHVLRTQCVLVGLCHMAVIMVAALTQTFKVW